MTERSQDRQPGSSAEELFTGWLAGWEAAEPHEFDALCRAHPEHAGELRKLHEDWQRIESLMRKAGLGVAPAAGESLARKLAAEYGSGVDPHVSLHEVEGESDSPPTSQLLERLKEHALKATRYRLHGEIGRGGMGAILKVWDEDLRRNLAMKVILGKTESSTEGKTPPVDKRLLARFLEEAQVTGQLDHPGIVPVHELGLDAEGRVYFTMKLVKGRDLKQIFELVFAEQEGWNETRALGVILKVCDAMAYAHKKGVIHRDLKPANVMVGGFGEVFVMDWGLARVLGQKDTHDLRLQPMAATSSLATERREERLDAPDSPLFTMDGDVVGTPCYMPPEQARGEIEKLSARSDVYSIGAMLYHLLVRQMPYCPPDVRVTNRTVLGMVLHGPPASIEGLRKGVPAELVAICTKAMARESSERYEDTRALVDDLRAYLEGRVVHAFETGAWAEARKWVARNRPLAMSSAAAFFLLISGVAGIAYVQARGRSKAEQLARANLVLAQEARDEATRAIQATGVARSREQEARWQSYVANIRAADMNLQSGNAAEAQRRLSACPEEYRHWEWKRLSLSADQSIATLKGHEAGIGMVHYLSDGQVLSLDYDGSLNRWSGNDADASATVRHLADKAFGMACSSDAKLLAFGTGDHVVTVFHAQTGEVLSTLSGHMEDVPAIAFSPNGKIATGSWDKTVRLWDALSGALITTLEHDQGVMAVSFNAKGTMLASGAVDGTVRVWDAANYQLIATLSGDMEMPGFGETVNAIAFNRDGTQIAVGTQAGRIRSWRLDDSAPLALWTCQAHGGWVSAIEFSLDDAWLASASSDMTIRLWNATTGVARATLVGHTNTVTSVDFSPGGARIASGGADRTIKLWDVLAGDVSAEIHDDANSIAIRPGSREVASTSSLWKLPSCEKRVHLGSTANAVRPKRWTLLCLAFSPDGARIAAGTGGGGACLFDAESGEAILALEVGHPDNVWGVAYSSDGTRVATASEDKAVRVWDAVTGQLDMELEGHMDRACAVAFSPDGARLASGSWDDTVRIWDLVSMREIATLDGHGFSVSAVAFSPDGHLLASASDKIVRLWDANTWTLSAALEGHTENVRSVAFSADGTRLVSGGFDKTVRIWDVATGEALTTLRGQKGSVRAVAISPNDEFIASCSEDGSIRIWMTDLEQLRAYWRSAEERRKSDAFFDELLDPLFEKYVFAEDVVASLESSSGLDAELLAEAIERARSRSNMSFVWNDQAWYVVNPDGKGVGDAVEALKRSQRAVQLEPEAPAYRDTLAWALFANGRYEEALEEAQRALDMVGESEKGAYRGYLERLRARIEERRAQSQDAR